MNEEDECQQRVTDYVHNEESMVIEDVLTVYLAHVKFARSFDEHW